MSKNSFSARKMLLLGGAAILATAMSPVAAQAVPYAFASNQITNLTLQGAFTVNPTSPTASTSANDTAFFGGSAPSGFFATGVVGNALDIQAAVAGAAPTNENVFTPLGAGAFGAGGSRADASIGAGNVASGGVTVSNVAEAYGNQPGQASGQNTSTINIRITAGGGAITLSLTDTIRLIASTAALPGESANATVSNLFEVRDASGNVITGGSFQPGSINQQIGSAGGVPASANIGPGTFPLTFTTPSLIAGADYTLSLRSTASVTTTPGTPIPVPEPMSLALFGMGLAGLGLVRRRRA